MKILVCPLNWGLGHATRCVPVVRQLLKEGHQVVLAADGFPLEFLRQEFPELRTIEFPSYKILYSEGKSQVLAMFLAIPSIFRGIISEHKWLNNLLEKEHFDRVISDNRFGLFSKKTECYYITHQLMVKMPKGLNCFEFPVWKLHRFFINKYDQCLIPDFEGDENLSGDLSHKFPLPANAKFIEPLSRFKDIDVIQKEDKFDVVAIVSGVEPQRTLFEKYLIDRLKDSEEKVLILTGQPSKEKVEKVTGNVHLISHLDDLEFAEYLKGAKKIVARSGYSTIMDLWTLNCLDKAEFIPTPGQTEQEYLCEFHRSKM